MGTQKIYKNFKILLDKVYRCIFGGENTRAINAKCYSKDKGKGSVSKCASTVGRLW